MKKISGFSMNLRLQVGFGMAFFAVITAFGNLPTPQDIGGIQIKGKTGSVTESYRYSSLLKNFALLSKRIHIPPIH